MPDDDYASLFEEMVAGPLANVVGKTLIAVVYHVLPVDLPGFDVDVVNSSGGCQGIQLVFSGGEIELDWDWKSAFRVSDQETDTLSPKIAYHLVVRPESERRKAACPPAPDACGIGVLSATAAAPWNQFIMEPLLDVAVWGTPLSATRHSPQAAVFSFSSGRAVVSVGDARQLSIGDGDEMLVFREPEWSRSLPDLMLWELVPYWGINAEPGGNDG